MADELLAYRDRFPTLGRGPYFAAHTLGPMPETVPDALARFAAEWATDGVVAWTGWLEQIRATAALLEGLFGAFGFDRGGAAKLEKHPQHFARFARGVDN